MNKLKSVLTEGFSTQLLNTLIFEHMNSAEVAFSQHPLHNANAQTTGDPAKTTDFAFGTYVASYSCIESKHRTYDANSGRLAQALKTNRRA